MIIKKITMSRKKLFLLGVVGAIFINFVAYFYIQYSEEKNAHEKGFRNFAEMTKAMDLGFKNSDEYFNAIDKGFPDKKSFTDGLRLNFDNFDDYQKFKKGGFITKDEFMTSLAFGLEDSVQYRAAINGGFESGKEYLDAVRGKFSEVNQYREAKKLGYENNDDYSAGKLGKFSDAKEWKIASGNGFSDSATYHRSLQMKINNFLDYQYAIDKGYPNGSELAEGRLGDFENYNEFKMAKSYGMRTRQALLDFLDGNKSIEKCADGMTFERQRCEQEKLGKRLYFSGKVFNVRAENQAEIRLFTKEGNYADVIFRNQIAGNFSKEQQVRFWGNLSRVGTGIIIHHQVTDAVLD